MLISIVSRSQWDAWSFPRLEKKVARGRRSMERREVMERSTMLAALASANRLKMSDTVSTESASFYLGGHQFGKRCLSIDSTCST